MEVIGCKSWDCSAGEEKARGGDLINAYKCLKGGCKEDGTRLFASSDQGQNRSQWTQGETQKELCEHQETLLYWTSSDTACPVANAVASPSLETLKSCLNMVMDK